MGPPIMPMERVDEEYDTKMVGFEIDCNDGKGSAATCHYTAEFFSAVKQEHHRAAKIYSKNCYERKYDASCFNLGRYYCKFMLFVFLSGCDLVECSSFSKY